MSLKKAVGCLYGQLIGDALGCRYEFRCVADTHAMITKDTDKDNFLPILGGGPFRLPVGQITDDSEMAFSLASSLCRHDCFNPADVACAYVKWEQSSPPDIGTATRGALGIIDRLPDDWMEKMSDEEKEAEAYQAAVEIAEEVIVKDLLQYAAKEAIPVKARGTLINGDTSMMGYIGVALQSAFYEMLHAPSFYDGVVAAVSRGGDTDTNGAIVAALLGARFGVDEIPKAWIKTVRGAKPRSRALKLNFNIEEVAPQLLKLQ